MPAAGHDDAHAVRAIRAAACPLDTSPHCHAALLFALADARFALLGEASHGTEDFYRERAAITRRLIEDKGFDAVAVEADWPDALRVDRFVRGLSGDSSAALALGDFRRFPAWMWRNHAVREFVDWLRAFNQGRPEAERVGFYGIDLYSLYTSIGSVLAYLDRVDPDAAQRARYRYGCFEHFAEDTQAYGYAAAFDLEASCEDEAVAQLMELRQAGVDQAAGADAHFHAEQNARLVRNAEHYYRTMFKGRVASWNLRDQHMAQTLEALDTHLSARRARPARIAVWAHNSHLGDARATEMASSGELNVGQLMRQRYGTECFSVGFTTGTGEVTAASAWDQPAERKRINPPLAGSIEALLQEAGLERFALILRNNEVLAKALGERLERAIGVIYAPMTERHSHYFHARVAEQFDALVHLDRTAALEPLD